MSDLPTKGTWVPAYPSAFPSDNDPTHWPGISMRDYFAAKALVALLGSDRYVAGLDEACLKAKTEFKDGAAQMAYRFADAMLEARKK